MSALITCASKRQKQTRREEEGAAGFKFKIDGRSIFIVFGDKSFSAETMSFLSSFIIPYKCGSFLFGVCLNRAIIRLFVDLFRKK
ncbi:MAG: hypothetical protein AUJ12_03955 [Alphaproteobacteria bacterium CG1_02_46_17]|nr:MAG: hypothetical protein AUJ12_03955 [Alphaproteobacteria bacterium CG1_02_46_17]